MIRLTNNDLHPHLLKRMEQRGVTKSELETVLHEGETTKDAKIGTSGKRKVFKFEKSRQGLYFKQKEVTVYFKFKNDKLIILTVIARYGDNF